MHLTFLTIVALYLLIQFLTEPSANEKEIAKRAREDREFLERFNRAMDDGDFWR